MFECWAIRVRVLTSLLLLLWNSVAVAESCTQKLLGGRFDSNSHHLPEDKYPEHYTARMVVQTFVLQFCGVGFGSLVDVTDYSCKFLLPNEVHSEVCIVETQLGYFLHSRDMLGGVVLVFNRWD